MRRRRVSVDVGVRNDQVAALGDQRAVRVQLREHVVAAVIRIQHGHQPPAGAEARAHLVDYSRIDR